jgi:DNA-binding transcriptional LysR family regulator
MHWSNWSANSTARCSTASASRCANSSGQGLLPLAGQLLDQAREIESYLGGGSLAPLTVGATLTIGNYLATLVIAEYMRQHPEAPVSLQVANTQSIVERLLRFDCDLGLIEGEVSHPDLRVEPWLEDELVVFCSPAHALAAAGRADADTLSRQAWILREPGSGTRRQFDRAIVPGLRQFNLRLELEHTEAIKRAVESNLGIGCLRLACAKHFGAAAWSKSRPGLRSAPPLLRRAPRPPPRKPLAAGVPPDVRHRLRQRATDGRTGLAVHSVMNGAETR